MMAGIYIQGMDMPKSCISCPFMISRDNDDCILQSEEANESFENWEQMKAGCPLVEVPPHGALKDADALRAALGMGEICENCLVDKRYCQYEKIYTKMDICGCLDDAETIIPADPEEGEA